MPRLRAELLDVYCADTEDVTGADKLYVVGAVTDGAATKGVLTTPIKVNNDGKPRYFPPGQTVLFDSDVPNNRTIRIALQAFDEDSRVSTVR